MLEDLSDGVEILDSGHEVQFQSFPEDGGFFVEVVAVLPKQLLGLEVALGCDFADLEAVQPGLFGVLEEFQQEVFGTGDGDVLEAEVDLAVGLVCADVGRDVLGDGLVGVVVELEDFLGALFFGLVVQDVSEGLRPEVVAWLIVSDILVRPFLAGAEDELPALSQEIRRREDVLVPCWPNGLRMSYFRLILGHIIPFGLVLSQDVLAVPHHLLDLAGGGLVSTRHVGIDRRDVFLDGVRVVGVEWLGSCLFWLVEDIVVLGGKCGYLLLFLGVEVLRE